MTGSTDVAAGTLVFKILTAAEWANARDAGAFHGSQVDMRDGYIHLSTVHQVAETARRHFHGQRDLVVVAFDRTKVAHLLKWEPSRGGDLFPHAYGPLPVGASVWAKPLPLAPDGAPMIPGNLGPC